MDAVAELDQAVAGQFETFSRCEFCVHKQLPLVV
jgi:hypothetical protein